jgi:hypothetical protein
LGAEVGGVVGVVAGGVGVFVGDVDVLGGAEEVGGGAPFSDRKYHPSRRAITATAMKMILRWSIRASLSIQVHGTCLRLSHRPNIAETPIRSRQPHITPQSKHTIECFT